MGDEIEKYISHSIAERLQVMGNRLAYNISFLSILEIPAARQPGKLWK